MRVGVRVVVEVGVAVAVLVGVWVVVEVGVAVSVAVLVDVLVGVGVGVAAGAEQVLSRMLTLLELRLAAARSGRPSRLKSPTAMETGSVPTLSGEVGAAVKFPVPSPSRIVTLLELMLATARSGRPSRLKSPTATPRGSVPTLSGEEGAAVKSPVQYLAGW